MALYERFDDLRVRFGDANGWVTVGPLIAWGEDWIGDHGELSVMYGKIEMHARNGGVVVREMAHGIEPLAFAYLRDDLKSLGHACRGIICVGDREFPKTIQMRSVGPGRIAITASLAPLDALIVEIAEVSLADLSTVIADIDRIEERIGSLNGCWDPCAPPASGFSALPSP